MGCMQEAVSRELPDAIQWDVFVASTTHQARQAVTNALQSMSNGPRRVLQLSDLTLDRRSDAGVVSAMAESLLISRADVFVRLVVGTAGFSTFAFLSNAMRFQTEWTASLPGLQHTKSMPNYVTTNQCGKGRCFIAPPEVRMAGISWHGKKAMQRSCGNVMEKVVKQFGGEQDCGSFEEVALKTSKGEL